MSGDNTSPLLLSPALRLKNEVEQGNFREAVLIYMTEIKGYPHSSSPTRFVTGLLIDKLRFKYLAQLAYSTVSSHVPPPCSDPDLFTGAPNDLKVDDFASVLEFFVGTALNVDDGAKIGGEGHDINAVKEYIWSTGKSVSLMERLYLSQLYKPAELTYLAGLADLKCGGRVKRDVGNLFICLPTDVDTGDFDQVLGFIISQAIRRRIGMSTLNITCSAVFFGVATFVMGGFYEALKKRFF